jgi:hypothetical protein
MQENPKWEFEIWWGIVGIIGLGPYGILNNS